MLSLSHEKSWITEEVIDGEKLGEGACLGVGFLSGENGVAQSEMLPGGERFEHGLEQRLDIA